MQLSCLTAVAECLPIRQQAVIGATDATLTELRDKYNDGQRVSVSVSTAHQTPADSLRSSPFLGGDVGLTQGPDDSASNVQLSLIKAT